MVNIELFLTFYSHVYKKQDEKHNILSNLLEIYIWLLLLRANS